MHSGLDPAEELRASHGALVAYFHFDPLEERWEWTEEMYRIHGFEPGEVELSLDLVRQMRHPDDRERTSQEIRAAMRLAQPFSCYHRSIDRHGRTHRVVAVGAGALDEHDNIVACDGYLIDLTPDVRREASSAADEAVAAATAHRATIEQAKGVLMGTYAMDAASAFSMLRWFSQQYNVKVSVLAERLVAYVAGGEAADRDTCQRVDRMLHDVAANPDRASG